jgi:GWxTD domain-containing protein
MKRDYLINRLILIIVLLGSTPLYVFPRQGQEGLLREEAEDYFKRWLNEDVVYIITEEERAIFEKLSTPEEKEQFIEQFWFRRDPDPRTAVNEFKEEHYRRIAYANERFRSWRTDRGRIYIIHGPPAEIESHPSGGRYQRPMSEGGGETSTFPFQIWRYRYIEGIGDDVLLEFVDSSMSGEYELALYPEQKDALLRMPGGGLTMAEELGLAQKGDRPFFSPANREEYPLMTQSARNSPFARYEAYSMIQRPTALKYNDLKELVEVNVDYDLLPMTVREDYFRLGTEQVLVPVTLQLESKDLSFEPENGVLVSRVAVYGLVTSITNRVVNEFEDDLMVSCEPSQVQECMSREAMYQKTISLDRKMRYRLDLVVKDLNSDQIGVTRKALVPPKFSTDDLAVSSLILSNKIQLLESVPEADERFVLGDVKIFPSLRKEFSASVPLGLYFHVYNASLDQTTLAPSLRVNYKLFRGDRLLRQTIDENGESIQYFSNQLIVLVKGLRVEGLEPGDYRLEVEVSDLLSERQLTAVEKFRLVEENRLASAGN